MLPVAHEYSIDADTERTADHTRCATQIARLTRAGKSQRPYERTSKVRFETTLASGAGLTAAARSRGSDVTRIAIWRTPDNVNSAATTAARMWVSISPDFSAFRRHERATWSGVTSGARSLSWKSRTTSIHRVPDVNQLCVCNRAVCVVSCRAVLVYSRAPRVDTLLVGVPTRLDSIRENFTRSSLVVNPLRVDAIARGVLRDSSCRKFAREKGRRTSKRGKVRDRDRRRDIRARSETHESGRATTPLLTRLASCRVGVSCGMTRISSDDEWLVEVTTCTRNRTRNRNATQRRVVRDRSSDRRTACYKYRIYARQPQSFEISKCEREPVKGE